MPINTAKRKEIHNNILSWGMILTLKLLMLIQVSERERDSKRRESQLSFNANLISSYGGSKPRYILNPEKRKTLIRTRRSRSFVEADRATRIDEKIFGELSVSHKETAQ